MECDRLRVEQMFDKNLVLVDVEADSKEELLSKLCDYVYLKKKVKETFKEAVLKREIDFPTGLKTNHIKLAIPHTDSIHVIEPCILVAKLKKPVLFKEMGLYDNYILVDYVFLLMVKKDNHQVLLLQNLMNLCADDKSADELMAANSPEEVLSIIQKFYRENFEY